MPVNLQCESFPLARDRVSRLWSAVITYASHTDDVVEVVCVDKQRMRDLNVSYRKKDAPTNVLTFTYEDAQHDIVVCMPVVERESEERGVSIEDYAALVLVHAFLHAVGMDHERSEDEMTRMRDAEMSILDRCGFASDTL